MQIDGNEKEPHQKEHLRRQIRALRSGHKGTILEALKNIRVESSASILPELFDLLVDQEDEEITRNIVLLLNDLKSEEAVPYLAEAVINPAYSSIAHLLAGACWQNGLAYGKYAGHFVQAAAQGSYQTALEAFTVLEDALGQLTRNDRDRLIRSIRVQMAEAGDQKEILFRELVKILEQD